MEITVSGRHIEVTEAIKEYSSNKVAKLPRYFDRIVAIEVVLDKHDSHSTLVEIMVKVEHADPFIASSTSDDLYACIDVVVDKLERQAVNRRRVGAPRRGREFRRGTVLQQNHVTVDDLRFAAERALCGSPPSVQAGRTTRRAGDVGILEPT